MIKNELYRFARDESGVVSVDWIVLSASLICFCCLTIAIARDATFGLADHIQNATTTTNVGNTNSGN